MKKRYPEIDMLRGIAILAMILIHTCYYFLTNKTALFIWNWSQFAVPVFIFCSAYLFFQKPRTLSIAYLKKRLIRLIKPYYIFLLFFIPIFFIINPGISKLKYIIQSAFLTGGVDINWLVLLFVYLTILFPLLNLSFNKNRLLFLIYSVLALSSSIFFIFFKFPFSYKYILWLPWSVIPIFTLFFVLYEKRKNFVLILILLSGIAFAATYYLEFRSNHNLGMYENKYPPTTYFLSYGMLMISVIYIFSKILIKNTILTKIISFFSFYSYSIYFIHYTVLIVLATQLKNFPNWSLFFVTVLTITILTQIGINKLTKTYH